MAEIEKADAGDPEVTKRTLVREAMEKAGLEACIVEQERQLVAVAEGLSSHPGVHTVAVVDSEGRLLGIIPMRLLLDDLFLRVAPEEFLAELKDMEGVEEFGRISRARTARELMEEPAFVTMDDTAREAFARMHERRLDGLPIVDADMRVVGYLDRLQLLRLWLNQHGRGH